MWRYPIKWNNCSLRRHEIRFERLNHRTGLPNSRPLSTGAKSRALRLTRTWKPPDRSDIDLTLIGGDDLDLAVLGKIMDELDDLLLPYTFDLSLFSLIGDPEVREEIQRTGVVFYQRRNDA
ncbi:nucleotidyltransferase domain-containing protein [Roseiflexus castenholzii]|uniref:nucleotidyltransferase domain-containing protein n=1 Tax=Roseiflexus castenholzii TaxID=120962 RepID=UPI003C7DBE93